MMDRQLNFREKYPVVIELPVQWGDMDALNHVNNVVYLRWFESARIAYFDKVALMSYLAEAHIGPILASSEVKYRLPLEYPDKVLVGARTLEVRSHDLIHEYAVFSSTKNALATVGQSRVVMFDFAKQTKAELPDDVALKIKQLEGMIA